jgi:hypothetical protein
VTFVPIAVASVDAVIVIMVARHVEVVVVWHPAPASEPATD